MYLCIPQTLKSLMASILSIITTLRSKVIYLRTIDHVWVDCNTISVGNNAVTACCRVMGREGNYLIKCYHRTKPNLERIYGENAYPGELGLYSIDGRMEYIDIVLLPWVEGKPLDSIIGNNCETYPTLSRAFDKMALELLESEYAHGDLKPDNIIVGDDMHLSLIDLDAMWRPEFANELSAEIGTMAYRHPKRTHNYFKKSIDDYPIALISTMLAALALDKSLELRLDSNKTLLCPEECVYGNDATLSEIIALFERDGDMPHKQIAESLRSQSPMIYGLHKLLYIAVNGSSIGYRPPKHEEQAIVITPQQLSQARTKAGVVQSSTNKVKSSKWSEDDDLRLATLLFDGNRISSIARHMQRSERSIRERAKRLGIPLSELNRRKPLPQYSTACTKSKMEL